MNDYVAIHANAYIYVIYMFLFTYSLATQNLVLRIEYNERTDKQTTLNEINIVFINRTGAWDKSEPEYTVQNNNAITSQFHGNYVNHIDKNEKQTGLTTPTYISNQMEWKNKRFEARTIEFTNKYDVTNRNNEDGIKTVENKNKENVATVNHEDGMERDEYMTKLAAPNINQEDSIKTIKYLNPHNEVKTNYEDTLRTLEDYSNKNINIQPFFKKMDDASRIKNNLEAFAMIRKEKHIATPKFDFPATAFDKTYYDTKIIPKFKQFNILHFDEFNNRLGELPVMPNYGSTNFNNQQNNYFSKIHGLSDEKYERIQKFNNIHHPIDAEEGDYEKIPMRKNQDDGNYRRNRNENDDGYKFYQRSNDDFSTPKVNKRNVNNKQNNRLRNIHYANDYDHRINQNYNKVDYNKKIPKSKYDGTNFYNNDMNKNHNYNDKNHKINQNRNCIDHYNDQSREKFEKKQILDVLNKQNKLMEKIADRLLKNRIKREGGERIESWTEFDDIVKSLEARHNKSSGTTRKFASTTKTTKLPTIINLIDETEIRRALQKDPFVKRILKMANKKKLEYENQLKSVEIE